MVESNRKLACNKLCASKFVLSLICAYFSERGQLLLMRKLCKQFDRAVLESTRLTMALLKDKKRELLQKQQRIQGAAQEVYFDKVKLDRQKLVSELS